MAWASRDRAVVTRILIWPAFRTATDNRHPVLFARALATAGADVDELDLRALWPRHQVAIVHWPETALNRRRRTTRLAGALATIALLAWQRLWGVAVIWVTHNTRPHDRPDGALNRVFYRGLGRVVSGAIHPSPRSRVEAERVVDTLRTKPHLIVPLGPYPAVAVTPAVRQAVLDRFGIGPDDQVVCSFGQIRPYKGVPELVDAFRRLDAPTARLAVVGRCEDPELRAAIERAAGADRRIALVLSHLDIEALSALIERSCLFVTAYRHILNSGSVIQALSLGTPVACPFDGALGDLAADMGPCWMRELTPPPQPADLAAALAWAGAPRTGPAPIHDIDWDEGGRDVVAWLRREVLA